LEDKAVNEAIKMFSVILPYEVYEQLKVVAREQEVSIGRLLRDGAKLMLDECNEKTKNNAGA